MSCVSKSRFEGLRHGLNGTWRVHVRDVCAWKGNFSYANFFLLQLNQSSTRIQFRAQCSSDLSQGRSRLLTGTDLAK
jgi:hypothetical protein